MKQLALLLVTTISSFTVTAAEPVARLIFSIVRGFGNGVVANGPWLVALRFKRLAGTLGHAFF